MLASNLIQSSKPSLFLPSSFSPPRFPYRRTHQTLSQRTPWIYHPRRPLATLMPLPSKFFLPTKPNPNPNPKCKCRGGLEVNADEWVGNEEFQLGVELCMTKTLPPALTFVQGVEKLREAVRNLKAEPPSSRSGVLRFQVAVPPSAKALTWLCCQKKSMRVFPQYYFSRKQIDDGSDELSFEDGGVSGIGSAVCLYSSSLKECSLLARYLSIDSHLIRAYGFIGISYNRESSMMKQHGAFYSFIPQIELNELENCSFIASTLVWDNSLAYSFLEAVESLENCLEQINCISLNKMNYQDVSMYHIHEDPGLIVSDVQMVYIDAEVLAQIVAKGKCKQLVYSLSWKSFQLVVSFI